MSGQWSGVGGWWSVVGGQGTVVGGQCGRECKVCYIHFISVGRFENPVDRRFGRMYSLTAISTLIG
jgi:hypothetical protein